MSLQVETNLPEWLQPFTEGLTWGSWSFDRCLSIWRGHTTASTSPPPSRASSSEVNFEPSRHTFPASEHRFSCLKITKPWSRLIFVAGLPTWGKFPLTHTADLDWFFDHINQIADVSIKGSFSEERWTQLTQLFGSMSHQTHSSSHFCESTHGSVLGSTHGLFPRFFQRSAPHRTHTTQQTERQRKRDREREEKTRWKDKKEEKSDRDVERRREDKNEEREKNEKREEGMREEKETPWAPHYKFNCGFTTKLISSSHTKLVLFDPAFCNAWLCFTFRPGTSL